MTNVCKKMHTQKMFLPQFKNQKELDWENEYNCGSGGQPEGRESAGGRGHPLRPRHPARVGSTLQRGEGG